MNFSEKFQCYYCKEYFEFETVLTVHINESHKGPKGFICDFCDIIFDTLDKFIKHYQIKHDEDFSENGAQSTEINESESEKSIAKINTSIAFLNGKEEMLENMIKTENPLNSIVDKGPKVSCNPCNETFFSCKLLLEHTIQFHRNSKNNDQDTVETENGTVIESDLAQDFTEEKPSNGINQNHEPLEDLLEEISPMELDLIAENNASKNTDGLIKENHVERIKSRTENASPKKYILNLTLPTCQICGYVFKENQKHNTSRLDHYISFHFKNKFDQLITSLSCTMCKFKGVFKRSIERHYAGKHGFLEKFYQEMKNETPKVSCNLCSKAFLDCKSLLQHIDQCHEKNKSLPEKSSSTKPDPPNELNDSTSRVKIKKSRKWQKSKVCIICNMNLTNFLSYHDHFINKHFKEKFEKIIPKSKPFFCKSCPYKTDLKSNLTRHYSGKHKYLDIFLNEFLAAKDDIQNHSPLGEMNLKCSENENIETGMMMDVFISTEDFIKPIFNNLIDCVLQIVSVKKYNCEWCGQNFSDKRSLSSHKETKHLYVNDPTKKDKYCGICDKTFRVSSYLQYHMQSVHQKIKNFQCEKCDKAFNTELKLRTHNSIVHMKGLKKCRLCNFRYRPKFTNLDDHLQRAHGNNFIRNENAKDMVNTILIDVIDNVMEDVMTNPKIHKCEYCGNTFANDNILNEHFSVCQTNNPKPTYSCNQCEQSEIYQSKRSLNKHKKHFHKTQNYSCNICDVKLGPNDKLLHHMKVFHNSVRFKCEKCPKSFIFINQLRLHEKRFHCGGKLTMHKKPKCKICEESFLNLVTLNNHIRSIHGANFQFQCEKCLIGYETELKLKDHVKIHHIRKSSKHKCNVCSKRYSNDITLKVHCATVHGATNEKCEQCNYECKFKTMLDKHMNEEHKGFKCKYCNRLFAQRAYHQIHVETNHGNGSSIKKCTKCDFTTTNHLQLISHRRRYHGSRTEEGKFQCDHCKKFFSRKDNMDNHIKAVHQLVKDFKCGKCPLTFSRLDNMKRHSESVHEEKRTSICDFCGFVFKHAHHLKTHVQILHGAEPHAGKLCELCGKSFKESNSLGRHVREIHGGKKNYQ